MAKEKTGAEPTMISEGSKKPAADDELAKRAEKMVDRFAMWSGAAGLVPIPLFDMTIVAGVQFQMLRRLAQLYGVKFSDNLGKSVLTSLMGSLVPVTSGMGFASALKTVPVVGTVASLATMPAMSGGATYLIGRIFIRHFASGGTLLDFNPPDYREFIKEQAERLKTKLDSAPAEAAPAADAHSKGAANQSA